MQRVAPYASSPEVVAQAARLHALTDRVQLSRSAFGERALHREAQEAASPPTRAIKWRSSGITPGLEREVPDALLLSAPVHADHSSFEIDIDILALVSAEFAGPQVNASGRAYVDIVYVTVTYRTCW